MVSDQLSSQNNADSGGLLSAEHVDSIVNLVELSNSELTLSSGGDSLPVTGLLLDALLDLLGDRRPDLLIHAQRIGYICGGIAGQLKWTRKWTNNLVCAGLLHELGTLTLSSPQDYWNSIGTAEERLARSVSIDFLEATHGDSDLLEILTLSQNFRYRDHDDEETPPYVLQGAAALSAVRFFETCRALPEKPHQAPELLAALGNIYNKTEDETAVIDALESWLQTETEENFDPSIFLPSTMSNDPETAEIVRETFQEILDTFHALHTKFDSFFMLDGTGRFQIWSSKSEFFLGRSVRSMRNTHWSNEIVKYCNEEGFPFSDAQTPLYQTLTTGKPARLHLCMQDRDERLFEVEVNAIPIIGRDQLMQAILEFHKSVKPKEEPGTKIVHTAEDVSTLASELLAHFEQDPEQHPLPSVSFDKIDAFEVQLRSGVVSLPQPEPEEHEEASDSSIFTDDEAEENVPHDVSEITQSDVLDEEAVDQKSDEIASEDQDSEKSNDLESRLEHLMAESSESVDEDSDLSVTDSTIILKSSIGEESGTTFADEEFLFEEPESQVPEPADPQQVQPIEELHEQDVPTPVEESQADLQSGSPVIPETTDSETADEPLAVEEIDDPEPEPTDSIHSEQPVAEEEFVAPDEKPADDQEVVQEFAEEIPESVSSEDQFEPVPETEQSEVVESFGVGTEESPEQSTAESDFEISAMPPEEPAPVEEQKSISPTPLVIPELQPDPRDFPADLEEEQHSIPGVAEEAPQVAGKIPRVVEETSQVAETERDLVGHHEWEEYVKAVMDESSELHDSIGVLILEIDEIEAVTNEFGEQIVEDLMIEFTRRLSKLCSSRELSCRYGARQFTVACPGLELKAAYKRGDQLRHLFEKIRFDVMPIKKLTVSVGVTAAEPSETFDKLIHRLEFALSRSQKIGTNCCVALDSDEVRTEKQKEQEEEGSRILINEFVLTAEFEAMIASDMIVYKLGGFLYDLGAKLIKVDRKHVEMRVGARRLLPYWGKNPDSQPVLVDLQLGENWDQKKTTKRAVTNTTLQVRIRPDGWIKDKKVFKSRAEHVLRALKGYFAAK